MGWIKLIVVSAVGVYSYRSVSRVNQLVRQVGVPSHSLLGKYNSQGGHGLKKKSLNFDCFSMVHS